MSEIVAPLFPTSHAFKNITGEKFGRLLVFQFIGTSKTGESIWLCECDCGKQIQSRRSNLITGHTKSCGCLKRENKSNFKHGMKRTRIYNIWSRMIARCTRPSDAAYPSYGGRGVSVCDRWRDFINFYNDMIVKYEKHCNEHGIRNTTLDRVDNNGNYEPDNCRWATYKVQNANRRDTRLLTINGETKTLPDWSKISGISIHTIHSRINYGWHENDLLNPVNKNKSWRTKKKEECK